MSKIIMGNGGFAVAWLNRKVFQHGGRKQHKHVCHDFSFLIAETPWNSIKKCQTLTTHNTNRYCRIRIYTCRTTFAKTAVYLINEHGRPTFYQSL